MYQDQDSIKLFERVHARDRVRELARQIGHNGSKDLDVFSAHARTEDTEGVSGMALSFAAVAIVIGALFVFLG